MTTKAMGGGWVALLALGCSAAGPPPSRVAAPSLEPGPRPPIAASSAAESGGEAPGGSAARVACGPEQCHVGEETCCGNSTGDEGRCVATVPAGPDDAGQLLGGQILACQAVSAPTDSLRRCDDSGDCAASEACCNQFLYGGATADLCEPIATPGRSPCGFNEVCTVDADCRIEGATCRDGTCVKAASFECGQQRCAPGERCAGHPPRCMPGDTSTFPRWDCATSRDCLPGETCFVGIAGTQCLGSSATAAPVCESVADCPAPHRLCKTGQACVADSSRSFPVRHCACRP